MLTKCSPLVGYNNNVRHKGRLFHIQTEDFGVRYGHVISHVFADGGRILKSVKTSYSKYVDDDRMEEIVREMMRQQHKAMFIALRDGAFDSLTDIGSTSVDCAPASRGLGSHVTSASGEDSDGAPVDLPPPSAARSELSTVSAPDSMGTGGADRDAAVQLSSRTSEAETLVLEGIERSVETLAAASVTAEDLPPPPLRLFQERAATKADGASLSQSEIDVSRSASELPPRSVDSSPPAANSLLTEGRYAPSRPASIFGQARRQLGAFGFGADIARDKSLDDVILSFLAEKAERPNK